MKFKKKNFILIKNLCLYKFLLNYIEIIKIKLKINNI